MTATLTVPVLPGARPVPVQVGATPPAGMTLINPGDHGGTVWITAGPNGAAVPLTPGGSLRWTDPATYPYAALAAGAATAETVLVTGQLDTFDDPAAVAAATAAQLLATGVPSVGLDTAFPSLFVDSGRTVTQDIPGVASLTVSTLWARPTGATGAALLLSFTSPAVPDAQPIVVACCTDIAQDPVQTSWRMPAYGTRVTLTNLSVAQNPGVTVTLAGSNRQVPRFEILGGEVGAARLYLPAGGAPTAGTGYTLQPANDSGATGASRSTRMNGAVTLQLEGSGTGTLLPRWIEGAAGGVLHTSIPTHGAPETINWSHPRAPVSWLWVPAGSSAANSIQLTVLANN